jgi:hypothetical protein
MATKKKETASAVYKLPIEQVMAAVDLRKGDFYSKLPDEDKKSLNTFMAQRWASQVQGDRDLQEWYLLNVNDILNIDYVAITSNHEELRWKLLSRVGVGTKLRHEFIPPKARKKDKLSAWLIEQFPQLNDEEIDLFRSINPPDVLENIAIAQNMGNKDLKELFK